MTIRWPQTNASAVTPLPAILPTGSCHSIHFTSGQYSKKSHKFPKWTVAVILDHSSIIDHSKNHFRLFQECSRCSRTLHGPGWLWLCQLWKVLRKTTICWRNQLYVWAASVSRQNLSHRFVKAAAEINEGKATAADFDVDLPTGTMTFSWNLDFALLFLARKKSPITFRLLTMFQVV